MDSKGDNVSTASSSSTLTASCHCGSLSQPLRLPSPLLDENLPLGVPLCHCSACRHSTGLLCTSYMPIASPSPSTLAKTTAYPASPSPTPLSDNQCLQRYFCSTCGCHVFRSRPSRDAGAEDGEERERNGERDWEVATGALNNVVDFVRIERHDSVEDTKDGGLSIFITEQNHNPLPISPHSVTEHKEANPNDHHRDIAVAQLSHAQSPPRTESDILHAHCACNTVSFHICHPNASSLLPHSPFPDLMIPYHTKDWLIPNAGDEKWWLRTTGTKYLAGTCACRSCRLTSGFEVQTWAFVPRSNIYLHLLQQLPRPNSGDDGARCFEAGDEGREVIVPLDFDAFRELDRLGKGVLRGYESSPGVMREFCATCGATVFWHDKWRPELIDVSVGLLDAPEGARAEEWLEWWVERVSFEEDAGRDAEGGGKGVVKGWDLIPALKRGVGEWKRNRDKMERRKANDRGSESAA